jgi:hypothetical protein
VLSVPPWAQELISTTKGAVAFAGEIEQKKYVALGFELLPFEGKKSALTSILALNIIKFLSESGADVGFQAVGGRLHIPPDTAQVFYLDDDASLSASPADFVARRPGFVALSSRLAGTTLAAFNFFDETESDTLTSNRITVTEQKVESSDRKDVNLLSGFIATLVAIVLFLDLLITSCLAGRIKGLRGRA